MWQCDNCGSRGKVRRVELGGGSGANFCNKCLRKEIAWRKIKNKQLIKHYGSKKNAGKSLFRTKYKI